jgi:asparagine synthetase B (glutamine-hydrolysing)
MCGIYASLSQSDPIFPSHDLTQLLCNRGPDHIGETTAATQDGNVALLFLSTVLALRGGHIAAQPLISTLTGSTLCWNGEAWNISHAAVEGNDGEAVLALLASNAPRDSASKAMAHVLGILQSISGPFAFVFYDKPHDLLYFGRDRLGRRSLLYNVEETSGAVIFSSIADSASTAWREVEADGIYVLALNKTPCPSFIPIEPSSDIPIPFPLYHAPWGFIDNLSQNVSQP